MQINKYAIKHKFLSFLDQCINKGRIFVVLSYEKSVIYWK